MINQQHSITPSPELVEQWITEICHEGSSVPIAQCNMHIADCAAQWGADQELEACRCEVSFWVGKSMADRLQATRRPKPPSLKEQALEALGRMDQFPTTEDKVTILRALEQLND